MLFVRARLVSAALFASLLAACGGGHTGTAPAPAIKTSDTQHALSFDALPKSAPRPLAQSDSRAKVRNDSTVGINFKPEQLALLNARTPRQENFGAQRGPRT